MKKLLLVLVTLTLLVGCSNQKEYEKAMKENATLFYNEYQKGQQGLTNPTISIKQLKDANEYVDANYDLSKLEECKDESYVELIIDQDTKEVTGAKYYMQCE